jgi:ATP-binding cassette, subfamily B, bacterial
VEINQGNPLKRLFNYMIDYKGKIYRASSFSILNKLFDLAPPVLIGAAVDIVTRPAEQNVFAKLSTDPVTQLYYLAFFTLIIWMFESLFEYLFKIEWRNLAQTTEHKLRMDVYSHIQSLDNEFFEEEQSGKLMAIINDDVNQLERFLDVGANTILQILTSVILISMMFFALSIQVGLISMIPIPIIIYFSVWFQRKLEPKYRNVREQVGILNARLANNLGGISTIKSYAMEEFEINRIEESSEDYREANRKAILLSSAFTPLIRMVIVAGFIGMLIVGGLQVFEGNLIPAAYAVIVFLIQRLLWPLTTLGETFDLYQRSMASTNRALNLLDVKSKINSGDMRLLKEDIKGAIKFDNVDFAYKMRSKILNKFSVDIPQGQTIAFVGATGAGKSTIVKLMLRLYDPLSGKITLDGIDLRDLNLQDLRNSIGLVSQDTFILDGTVRDNIIYGKLNASRIEIKAAADVAEASEFIETLPDGFDTLVGERGQKLSGGQRQRISIARAVIKDPPILIFDEATSSVDNETEAAIQRSLEKLIVGRTTIIIAHRLSTIRKANKIFVLHLGEIIEEGTHEELIKLDGQYTNLWRVQTGEAILAKI